MQKKNRSPKKDLKRHEKLTEQKIELKKGVQGQGEKRKEGRGSGYPYSGKDVQFALPGDERLKGGPKSREGDEAKRRTEFKKKETKQAFA